MRVLGQRPPPWGGSDTLQPATGQSVDSGKGNKALIRSLRGAPASLTVWGFPMEKEPFLPYSGHSPVKEHLKCFLLTPSPAPLCGINLPPGSRGPWSVPLY
ncbi:unnamed protein product [Gulo gulo]|uniref:Uncharacterized protein n=1 Tax=Gulo gulo TaxID=48420 RepID=A0A9X9PWB0_GULGU|nr:unnamed protein product [Gulo gulo]